MGKIRRLVTGDHVMKLCCFDYKLNWTKVCTKFDGARDFHGCCSSVYSLIAPDPLHLVG